MNSQQCHSKKVDDLVVKLPKDVRDLREEVFHAINCGKKLVGWNGNDELTIDGGVCSQYKYLKACKVHFVPRG